ncbi:hypothetical protein D3C80_1687620 [compost metagenome]
MGQLQIIVGHFGRQVMHMMKADVAGDPLQQLRQLVIRASFYGSHNIAPFLFMLKKSILKLMLHIEQPDAQET